MKLIWSLSARADLRQIHSYIDFRNPPAANRVKLRIVEAVRNLVDFPGMGRPHKRHGIREFPVTGLPYIIVYRVVSDVIEIIAVDDGRMDREADWE
jgi:toxin ParE1/3/4